MGTLYAVPVFHHGESFVRHPNGELGYANCDVKRFEDYELDIDHINMGNLVMMLDELGYKNHKAMHWYDRTAPELETGINEIDGNQEICELIDWLRANEEPEFHIYIEHTISKPILAKDLRGYVRVGAGVNVDTINLDDSSNNACDEGAKDDMFDIPNPGIDSSNEADIGASRIMTT